MINEFKTKEKKFKPRIKLNHNIIILCFIFQLSGIKNSQQRFWCAVMKERKSKRCILIQRKWLKPITLATIDTGTLTRQRKSKRCLLTQRKWLKPITLARIYAGKIINYAFNVITMYFSFPGGE